MSIIYNPKDVFVVQRNTTSSSFEEKVLSSSPNAVFFFDSDKNVIALPTSSIAGGTAISSSYANSSSVANTATSASYALRSDTSSYLNPGANIYLSQSYIYSDVSASKPPFVESQMWWDSINHTYAIDTIQSRLQIGQENYIRVVAGEDIFNGGVVYLDGATTDPHDPSSQIPLAFLALADGTGLKDGIVGMSTQTLLIGEEGFITTQGIVNDLDTQTPDFSPGDTVYLSFTQSGSLVNTIPPDPFEKIVVGTVLYRNFSTGRILIETSILPSLFSQYVGPIDIPTLSNTGSTSGSIVNIGSIGVRLCETADGKGLVKNYTVPTASFIITSSLLDVQNLIVTYNSGSPIYSIVTDLSTVDDIQTTPVATFTIGTGGALSYVDWDTSGILLANKLNNRIIALWGAQRATGLTIAASGSHITLTAGTGFLGVKALTFTTSSTEIPRQFVLLGHSASIWSGSFLTGWVNDRYDNGTDFVSLDTDKYVINYVFRGIGSQNRSQVILSTQYDTYGDAVEAIMPETPAEMGSISILCGRIIAKQGDATAQLVESAFTTIFSVAGITQHNNLNGLQGGVANQYYHLTSAEYSGLGVSASYANSSSYSTTASYALDTPAAISSSHALQTDSASYLIPGNPLHLSNSYIQSAASMSAPPWKEGRLFWDKVNHTYALYNDVNGVTLQLGQENYIHVIAGEDIANASAVYIDGPQQDPDNPTNWIPKIYKALADTSVSPGIDKVAGLTTHAFTSGSIGWITIIGIVHDADTSIFTPGATLYLSPTVLGGYQEANPGQPYSTVEIGTVIQSDVNGSILVNPLVVPPPSNAYAGMITIPTIGNNNNGTVTVSTGSVNLYSNPSGIGAVTSYNIPETTLTLVSGSTNYITARVSSSLVEGEYFLTTDATYANGISIVRVAQLDIYTAEGTQWDVHQFNVGIIGLALANRINNKDIKLYGFQRQDGLTLYTTGSDGQFGITEGNIWYGPNSSLVDVFDTTLPGYYTYIFHTSGSGWYQYTSSVYLNGVYDNGAGSSSLTICGPSSWSINFVYRIIGTTDECAIVMSNAQYDTELEASNNATTPANLPSTIRDQCLLVGRFVVQSGSYASTQIESAFSNIFIPATVTDHESLLGLQGSTIGAGSGHYHLKSDDYTGTGTGVMVRTDKPSFTGATPYHIPYWNTQQQLTLTGSVQVYNGEYVVINSGSPNPVFPEALLVKQVNTSSALCIGAYGTVDNFFQIYNQNLSSGSEASTDICATADIGNQDANFIDMGIAGSGFASVFWPFEKPLDGYIYVHGGDFWVGTLTDNKLLFVFNNTASTNYADKTGFYLSGSLKGTSSWANNAISASWAPDQTVTVISASWASASISASYVSNLYPQTYQESASWASASVSASYVPNLYSQTTVPSASWVSASAFITTAQTASFVSAANVVGTVTSASFAISASWAPDQTVTVNSASWASSSLSSSYASGIPTIKSGIVAGATFSTTNPRTASIVFTKPFLDNNYSVVVTGESSRTWTIQSKVSGSFVINSNNDGVIANNTFWQATATGEYYS